MANTLGLDDDLDGVEVLERIEHGFALKIPDEIAESLVTVGDIHDVLIAELKPSGDRPGGCATAMAFYRLRRALRLEGAADPIRVDTDLTASNWPSVRRLSKRLKSEFGLRLPDPLVSWPSGLGLLMVLSGLVGILVVSRVPEAHWSAPLAVAILGGVLMYLDPWRLPDDAGTVGELSLRMARLNRGVLARQGAAFRLSDVWDDLVEVLAQHSELPKSEIRADTVLLQSQFDRSRAA